MTERTNPPLCGSCERVTVAEEGQWCPSCLGEKTAAPMGGAVLFPGPRSPSPTDDPARLLDACRYPEPVPTMHDKGTPISVGYEATFKLIARLVRQRDDLERTAQAAEEMRDKADAELARLRMGQESPTAVDALEAAAVLFTGWRDAGVDGPYAEHLEQCTLTDVISELRRQKRMLTGGARVTPEERNALAEAQRIADRAGKTLADVRERFGLEPTANPLDAVRDELGAMRIERDRYRREVKGLNKAIAGHQNQIFELQARLARKQDECNKLREQVCDEQDRLADAKDEYRRGVEAAAEVVSTWCNDPVVRARVNDLLDGGEK